MGSRQEGIAHTCCNAGHRRGQAAMEYLLISAFAFTLLVPIVLIAYSQSAAFSQDVSASQIQKVGAQIVDAANAVYYAGPPAKKTVVLYFPQQIQSITINETAIDFLVSGTGGTYEYAAFAATNMSGTIQTFSGTHTITVTALASSVNITDR